MKKRLTKEAGSSWRGIVQRRKTIKKMHRSVGGALARSTCVPRQGVNIFHVAGRGRQGPLRRAADQPRLSEGGGDQSGAMSSKEV